MLHLKPLYANNFLDSYRKELEEANRRVRSRERHARVKPPSSSQLGYVRSSPETDPLSRPMA